MKGSQAFSQTRFRQPRQSASSSCPPPSRPWGFAPVFFCPAPRFCAGIASPLLHSGFAHAQLSK
jgi:hypothetical protein